MRGGGACSVVLASSTDHVRAAVRVAAAHDLPIVPQGARSGLSGGANAITDCLVISLERMNQIKEIDVANGIAIVEPGVLNA